MESRIFGGNHDLLLRGVTLQGNEITLCGSMTIEGKVSEPNNTREWDPGWMRGDLTGGAIQSGSLDLPRDDFAYTCKVDTQGALIFAGTNDFVSVDTNSWVEFGQGFLLRVDRAGNETSRRILRGPRHTSILAFDWSPDGKIAFGGMFDAPKDHAAPEENGRKAMLGVTPALE